ncbi:MAG TPA: PfkB family carbohydrate kinase [Solirubrobacteraceae bacterium]
MAHFDYVTVGHVTIDVLADLPSLDPRYPDAEGQRQPGGGAFYSALQAARLGLRTLIITRGIPREIEALLEPYRDELHLRVAPAEHTTTLLTRGGGHARRQQLLAWAGPIAAPAELDTAILHLAPIARETPRTFSGRADFVGLTPQGLVRRWEERGAITTGALNRALLPERYDAVVLSASELAGCAELLPVAGGQLVAVTSGAQPTAIHVPGGAPLRVPASPIAGPRDDLGAGDVFAAAFFVALHEGLDPKAAGTLATAAAAVRIAGVGPHAIGDRQAVLAQLSQPPVPRR